MKMKSFWILLCAVCFVSWQTVEANEYSIIPQPVNITYSTGSIKLKASPVIVSSSHLMNEAQMLQSYLLSDFAMKAKLSTKSAKGDIVLAIDASVMPDKKEAYILDASGNSIIIKGNSPAGVFNGIQTLRQIIKNNGGVKSVEKGTITDYPAFSWRAFMLDEGRHFKGEKVVLQLLDEMAALKLNTFHWHLTEDQGWRIEIKKYPKLTEIGAYRDSTEIGHFGNNKFDGKRHGGFYTQDQIKSIVAYAAKRHITIIPEVEMPGHASAAIASYPWLGTTGKQIQVPCKFGVQYEVYNVADPRVLKFLNDVMDEVIALFPAPIFHIGGDEVRYDHWNESQMVKDYMAQNNLGTPTELQIFFTNKVSNLLADKGRRMMGWNEIVGSKVNDYQKEAGKEMNTKLNPQTIVHFWKGDPKLIKEAIEKGYDVVNSYHVYTYLDYDYKATSLEKAYSFNPITEGLTPDQQKKILGMGCQMWGEFIPTVESMNYKVYPRIAAYAEDGWTPAENKDYQRFLKSLPYFLGKWKAAGIQYGPLTAESAK